MTLRPSEIQQVVLWLDPLLRGGKIQEIRQPEPHILVLSIRQPGTTHTLLLDATPALTRLHLTEEKWPNAPNPPGFLQRSRKEISGIRITSVAVIEPRTIQLSLKRHGPDEVDTSQYALILELDGRYPNLLLLDSEHLILARIGGSPLPERLRTGEEYALPKSRPVRDEENRFASMEGEELDAAIERAFSKARASKTREALLRFYRKALKRAIAREARKEAKVNEDFERAEGADATQRYGELLKTHVHQLQRGLHEISVPDYFSEGIPTVAIPLDPKLNGPENIRRLFHQARRFKDARSFITTRRKKIRERRKELAGLHTRLDALSTDADPAELIQELHRLRIRPPSEHTHRRKAQPAPKTSYRTYRAKEGSEILVGRNAEQNDTLTFRVARGDDLWFHARGRRGAHVVLRTIRGKEPHPEAIEDAAQLAAYHSEGGRTDTGVEVWVVPKKHVRKARNAPPGTVTVAKGKTRLIRPSSTRLDRLLDRKEC